MPRQSGLRTLTLVSKSELESVRTVRGMDNGVLSRE